MQISLVDHCLPAKLGTFSLFFNLEEHVDYVSVLCQAGLKGQNFATKMISLPIFLCLVFTVQFSEDVDNHYESYHRSLYSHLNLVPPAWWLYTVENWNPITFHNVETLIKHDQLNTIMTPRKHWLDFQSEEKGFS